MAYCTKCGTDLASGVRYCASCSTAVSPEMSSSSGETSTDPAIREQVAEALVNRAVAHGDQGDNAAAIADYTLVVESYSADADPAIRELVAEALVNRAVAHGDQGDYAAEIADYTLVVESYSADADPAIREQVAAALNNRGITHRDQGDFTAAIADLTLVVESYSADADPAIREQVVAARDAIVTRIVEHATSSWEEGFAHLEQYVAAHGDARVPDGRKTEDGYTLGQWVRNQRSTRSTMSAERVTRLDGLGFVWDAIETKWEEGFAHLEQYVEAQGDARVSTAFKTEGGYNLGSWVSNQRSRRSTLSAERVTRLEAVSGWVWDGQEAAWEEGFAHLEQYVAAQGDARVLSSFKTENGYNLGRWVSKQRSNRSTLSAERVTRLDGRGFVWKPPIGRKSSR